MKIGFINQIFGITLIALLLIPSVIEAEDIESNYIEIDRHWIYLFQQDDLKTFEVNEYFLLNNTGEDIFNGSIRFHIQNNSIIVEECFNGTLNMACRYNATGCGECFYLNKSEEGNFFVGNPFPDENKLSYYGQKELISITAFSTTNTHLNNNTLHLNATIGGLSIPRNKEIHQESGIHITSENLDIGMLPLIATFMPYYITTFENMTILNNSTDTELIDFNIGNFPKDWTVEIWNNTEKINNVSLSPQEYQNLTLKITAPSNIASIIVSYFTQIDTDSDDNKGIFTKQYLYDTKKVTYDVYLLTIDELDLSNDLEMVHNELFWLEEYERYWFIARNENILPNNYTSISMSLEKTIDYQPNPYLILVAIFILILIIISLFLKKIGFFTKINGKQNATLEEKKITNKEKVEKIKELEEQKKSVLLAIKRVEKEFEDKTISKKDYERFRATYKKRAIEILKDIDRLKELNK